MYLHYESFHTLAKARTDVYVYIRNALLRLQLRLSFKFHMEFSLLLGALYCCYSCARSSLLAFLGHYQSGFCTFSRKTTEFSNCIETVTVHVERYDCIRER